ncbi:hypothetical protein [Bacteriovorax sp. Seq25_V]|uniref:hypothetical protein n=1 Tax=Bacteriovorax sp. Seq25_V TaxID=1201288 RepID=UPI00038A107D|nr:hypothetical protein [Bacteriovorax sp. Seq25_V]EQC46187.1 hypothetical protein M900_1575 [Bacteriovorax sp. Seq25_V]
MRKTSRDLNISYQTVQRKMIFLAKKSQQKQKRYLKSLEKKKIKSLQFDDLVTIEHTKMKPLSISVAVDKDSRRILGARVSRLPANGPLADKSRKKYGYRKSNHKKELNNLLKTISKSVAPNALIETDEHALYPKYVKKYFPKSTHKQYKSIRGCVAGQGELKKARFDPLFKINHTLAMFRASINRLIRRSWCTTKRIDMLQNHVDIFIAYFNFYYLRPKPAPH